MGSTRYLRLLCGSIVVTFQFFCDLVGLSLAVFLTSLCFHCRFIDAPRSLRCHIVVTFIQFLNRNNLFPQQSLAASVSSAFVTRSHIV